ncbi:type IV pili methyl-accepting chemotaxis transducer N-terminal domain-containing protein [Tateyamaria sp. ANG-S1]|uniref:type IV pili methyl-accepting chemotaxis transducer N-terminal domain-containing protein n=1 Tax=Tateyamaria sp. ANG-S1 TaxID=1577905 RepID=UPI00057E8038|nr:type IV pili methyl-accepting chemotaxis transducer N-terminal domain-containing protein [Tateyamaria sp. ANG-S1]KIC50973.1 hypothetical protein RA29_03550 [Tateyamaria sp. ANG-S1]
MRFLTRLFGVLTLVLGLCGPAARADTLTVRDWADQAVLVHRVTKSVCLLFVGATMEVHLKDVADSSARLMARSGTLGIVAAADLSLSADIATLTSSARQIAAGDRHSVAVRLLLRKNPVLSSRYADKRTDALSGVADQLDGSYALLQEMRVLSQKFQRDLCLFLTDLAPADAAGAVSSDIAMFEKALDQLVNGDAAAGLVAAPNIHIKVTLGKVMAKWQTLKPILTAAAAGEVPDPRNAQLASVLGDAILVNLDDVSDRFEAL